MCPSLIRIGWKTAEKNSAQANGHYENNGHLAVNQYKAGHRASSDRGMLINGAKRTGLFISDDEQHAHGRRQGRAQEGADGAKAPPEIPRKILFTHSNPEHFMFRSLYKEVSFTITL